MKTAILSAADVSG